MQHFQFELLIGFNAALIELEDVIVSDTQARCVEIKFRLLFRCDTDTYLARTVNGIVQQVQFPFVIQNRNGVFKPVINQ